MHHPRLSSVLRAMYSSLYGLRVGKPAIIPPDFEPFLKVLTEYFIPFHLSALLLDTSDLL
jgi:hypothetical protein